MSNPVILLEKIQKIDLEIKEIGEKRAEYKRRLEGLFQEIKTLEEKVEGFSKELQGFEDSIKEIEERIRQNEEKIKRDEKRLDDVKNEKEYNALIKEINSAKKSNRNNEQQLTSLLDKAEKKRSLLEEREGELKRKRDEHKNLVQEMEMKSVEWEKTVEEKKRLRETIVKDVRPDLLRRYETIRTKRGGLGVVGVSNETCLGCYMHIPPQMYIQLKMGTEEIISCPHCHRLLYFEKGGQSEVV